MWQLGIGGAERAVFQLVREQRRRGVQADVVVGSTPGLYAGRLAETGAQVHELGCTGAWDVVRSRRLTSLARRYDVVHVHGVEPLLIAAAARSGRTLVYTHRGGVRTHGWRKRLRLAAARPYLNRFDAISGNTRQSARAVALWLGLSPEEMPVVYNGIDFELLRPAREPGAVLSELPWRRALLVGTAAKLQPWKRIERLLDALPGLGSNVGCLVLGEGPIRVDLERRAAELGVDDRVAFLGRKEHVGDYLQLLDVFVLPSGPEEAFGNAAVEAMGLGIPTVVFEDGGGLVEHVRDSETGCVVGSIDGLAAALRNLLADASLRERVGSAGRTFVRERYSLDAMFASYSALYTRAIGGAVGSSA